MLSKFSIQTVRSVAIVLSAIVFAVFVSGEDSESAPIETRIAGIEQSPLAHLISSALESNPGLQALERRYEAAKSEVTVAHGLPNPRVQWTHFVESIQTRTGPQRDALSVRMPFPAKGTLSTRSESARAMARALWFGYNAAQLEVVDQVSESAIEIAFLNRKLALQEKSQFLLETLEDLSTEKLRVGGSLERVLRIQIARERLEEQLDETRFEIALQQTQLLPLLGHPVSAASVRYELEKPNPFSTSRTEYLAQIEERNPSLGVLRSLASSAEARERLAKLGNRPEYSVGINYINTGKTKASGVAGSGKDPWAFVVGVSLPIFKQRTNALVDRNRFEGEAIERELEEERLRLISNGTQWLDRVERAMDSSKRYEEELIPLASDLRDLILDDYKVGGREFEAFIDAEQTLLSMEIEYWNAVANREKSRWRLVTLSGGMWVE